MTLDTAKSCKPDVLVIYVSLVSCGIAVLLFESSELRSFTELAWVFVSKLRSPAPQFPPAFQEIILLIG